MDWKASPFSAAAPGKVLARYTIRERSFFKETQTLKLQAPACCPATLDQLCVVQLDLRLATSLGCLRECAGLGCDHTDPNRVLPFHVIPDRLTERRGPQCRHGLQVSHPDSLVGSGAVVPRYVVHGLEGLSVLWAIRSWREQRSHFEHGVVFKPCVAATSHPSTTWTLEAKCVEQSSCLFAAISLFLARCPSQLSSPISKNTIPHRICAILCKSVLLVYFFLVTNV